MNFDDGHDEFDTDVGGTGQTRTRLPETITVSDVYGGARRPMRNSRSLVTAAGVVVLLIAAIAFANRGNGSAPASDSARQARTAAPTAATGVRPVAGKDGEIPKGYAHDEQGAQSAASNFAVALGSADMFQRESRHRIVDAVYTPQAAAALKDPQDNAYSAAFLAKLGLDPDGDAPEGSTFVSRTIPVGTKIDSFSDTKATVSVWYTGLVGMAGEGSKDPVRTTWKTWTFRLQWTGNDWKVAEDSEKEGPAPVPGDLTASGSEEISKAVQEFGGFTYAR
ncbi:hypothetical protein V1460_02570 [Streptomyces sp. SCSIO 30461]|uniref:hypothetical protein n=1 Tax=Streptomyces sp. SCSIO 30461 TaxID=3118085 RepID=UPI0030D51183